MKKNFNWVLVAILTLSSTMSAYAQYKNKTITRQRHLLLAMFAAAVLLLGMTGCTKSDNPISDNPSAVDVSALEQELVGLWWDEYEYADVTEAGAPFTRVLLAVLAEAGHTGCIYRGVFDDTSDEPLAVYGGPEEAGFTWRLLADGTVLLSDPVTGETYAMARTRGDVGSYGKDMTDVASTNVNYTGGNNLTLTNDDYSGTLTKADAAKEADIKEKLQAIITTVDGGDTGIGLGGGSNGPAKARSH